MTETPNSKWTFTTSQLWLMGAIGAVVVLFLIVFTVTRSQRAQQPTALFTGTVFHKEDLMQIELAFANADLKDYSIQENVVLVPYGKREAYLKAIQKAGIFVPENVVSKRSSTSLWQSEAQREAERLEEKQIQLARQIRNFHGVEAACVFLDTTECKQGFSKQKISSASVRIHSQEGYAVSDSDILAIRRFIVCAVLGLKPENVVIIDTRTNRSWEAGDATATPPTLPQTAPADSPAPPVPPAPPAPPVDSVDVDTAGTAVNLYHFSATEAESVFRSTEKKAVPTPATFVDDAALHILDEGEPLICEVPTLPPPTQNVWYNSSTSSVPSSQNQESEILRNPMVYGIAGGIGLFCLGLVFFQGGVQKPRPRIPERLLSEIEKASENFPENVSRNSPELPALSGPQESKRPEAPLTESQRRLQTVPSETLAEILEGERPQTIALVLSQLNQEQGGKVLQCLKQETQTEVILRMGACMETDAEVLDEVLCTVLEAA